MAKKETYQGMTIVHGPWDGQEGPQTTEIKLAPDTGDAWERIETRAREDMARHGRLWAAVESMKREQSWQKPETVEPAGDGQACDLCAGAATFAWFRTAKEVKRIERTKKLHGSALPVSYRCAVHVPVSLPELGQNYRAQDQGATVGAAA